MGVDGDLPRVIRARVEEERSAGRVSRRVVFGLAGAAPRTITWDVLGPDAALPSPLTRHDLAAAALIHLVMREGCDLHIEGPVSEKLLANLEEFQRVWTLWRPDLYKTVRLSADQEITARRDDLERQRTAVIAFSGGVDSTTTLYRHHAGLAGRSTRKIRTAFLVKGFDIPLDRVEGWQVAVDSAARTLADIDTPLCVVETNWRTVTGADWEMEFAAGVISCLRQWEDDVDTLIMAADYDYARFVVPWGANPVTNPLLEGNDTSIPFDGAELSRSEKVSLLSKWPAGYDALRVCYEDDITGRNCGVCSKCMMTKMNALAYGLPVPASLQRPPTVAEIHKLDRVTVLFGQTLDVADANGVKSPLFEALRARKKAIKYVILGERAKRKAKHILQHRRW